MYLFYDSNGRIASSIGAVAPEELTYIPVGYTALYLDDNEYPDIKNNYTNYTIINDVPMHTPIPDSVKLPYTQEAKIEEINLACNLEILNGFVSSCTGIEYGYKFDLEYQANLNQQMGMLSLDSAICEIPWPTKNAGVIIHQRSQFIQLLKDASDFKSSRLFRYFDMKEQIINCLTTDEVKLINW